MKRIAAILIIVLLFLSAYSAYVNFNLRTQAQKLAGERPFCVQVSDKTGYTAAREVKDTLGLLMRGAGAYHHAVLVVGNVKSPETYHWSYFKNKFVLGTYGPFPIVCFPNHNYFSDPKVDHNKDNLTFALHGKVFSIPKVFHPKPVWPGSMIGFQYLATAPSFIPASEKCSQRLCNMVLVAFHGGTTPEGWADRSEEHYRIEDLGKVYGLSARRLTALNGKQYVTNDYIERDVNGKVVTYITCFDSTIVQCTHLFSKLGMTYSFHHMPADLPQWAKMQESLINLSKAFEMQGETMLSKTTSSNAK